MENIWICECGQENVDKFCKACGTARRKIVSDTAVLNNNMDYSEKNNEKDFIKNIISDDVKKIEKNSSIEGVEKQESIIVSTVVSKEQNDIPESISKDNTWTKSSILYGIIAVLIVAVTVMGGYLLFGNDETMMAQDVKKESLHSDIPAKKESNSVKNAKDINTNVQNIKSTEKDNALNEKKNTKKQMELSLNGIWLDDTKMNIEKILGKPNSTNFDGKYNHSFYDDIEVVYYGNEVVTLISEGNRFKTEKGISAGMSKKDVIRNYGESSMAYTYDDLRLYEYEVESKDGRKGLLRFAVKINDDKVNYISVRIPDEWISYKKR